MLAEQTKALKIDHTKLYTQSAYARKIKVSAPRVSQMIDEKKVKTVLINGAILIYAE